MDRAVVHRLNQKLVNNSKSKIDETHTNTQTHIRNRIEA